eukprot:TRINITY_DN64470_c0_g1_i1.p1 TRINITY_DN64470_c0_g1~~TRINITY_DN64470_c0_g1_i1.p1  ORF type:complete len:465 (+),score=75.71 TRINITY_DN64470_c0_g1_i1:103-1497(+)
MLRQKTKTGTTKKSFCELSRNNNGRILLTDVNESYGNERKQLKLSFIEKEKEQNGDYLQDLERTVKINKEIISELLKGDKLQSTYKSVCEKLNLENSTLHKQVEEARKGRDESQAKVLICSQIIEDYKRKEEENREEFAEKKRELLDQLSRKEYMLQLHERRYLKVEELLVKYAKQEQEVWKSIKEMNLEINGVPKSIENVAAENETLSKKLIQCQNQIKSLEAKLADLVKENDRKAKLIEDLKKGDKTLKAPSSNARVPPLDFSKLQKYSSTLSNNVAYIHKLEETIKSKNTEIIKLNAQVDSLKENNQKLESDLKQLFGINKKLSNALQEASNKLDHLKNKSFANRSSLYIKKSEEDTNKLPTASTMNRSGRASSVTPARAKHKKEFCGDTSNITKGDDNLHNKSFYGADPLNESFGEVSSIEEVVDTPKRIDYSKTQSELFSYCNFISMFIHIIFVLEYCE